MPCALHPAATSHILALGCAASSTGASFIAMPMEPLILSLRVRKAWRACMGGGGGKAAGEESLGCEVPGTGRLQAGGPVPVGPYQCQHRRPLPALPSCPRSPRAAAS